jgi:predicted DNA-binding transcriptional regulator AlpA
MDGTEHLSEKRLARRWGLSHRTLERWRETGEGPRFLKIGGRVVYRMAEIEAFEVTQLRSRTLPPRSSRGAS